MYVYVYIFFMPISLSCAEHGQGGIRQYSYLMQQIMMCKDCSVYVCYNLFIGFIPVCYAHYNGHRHIKSTSCDVAAGIRELRNFSKYG